MNKILFLLVLFFSNTSFGQEIVDTMLFKIPYLGKEGGQHILNINIDESSPSKLIFNVYSHINGNQLIANPSEINESKKRYDEKNYFEKFLSSALKGNIYSDVVLPVVSELKIDIKNKNIQERKELFYTIDNVPSDKKVYYMGNSGMVDLKMRFNMGNILNHHYSDINNVFKTFPTLNQNLLNIIDVDIKGDGLFQIKNIQSKLVRKEIIFSYDKKKGFITSPIYSTIANTSEILEDNNFTYVNESNDIYKQKSYSWYKNKESNSYKFLMYDGEHNSKKIETFNFENRRDVKVINKPIYDEENEKVGYLNIFGFSKKQDKNKKIFKEQEFNVVIVDLDGNITYNAILEYGDLKSYKNVLNPIYIIKKENGNLLFSNLYDRNAFNTYYQTCELNITENKISEITNTESKVKLDDNIFYLNRVLNQYDLKYKINNGYIFIKTNIDIELQTNKEIYNGFTMIITDKNLIPLKGYSNKNMSEKNKFSNISYYNILNKNNEFIMLTKQGSSFYLTKINDNNIGTLLIRSPYLDTADNEFYYAYYLQNPFVNDSENRFLYLIDQYYKKVDNTKNLIDRIGITKINY